MKRIYNIFRNILLTAFVGAAVVSCAEKEENVAHAVLGDVSILDFEAVPSGPKVVNVVSDGPWHVTAPDWITVDPTTGSGSVDVTVTVAENKDAIGLLVPRKDTLMFSGSSISSRYIIIVCQAGDQYRDAQHLSIKDIIALNDGQAFYMDEATVAAVATSGFVANDATGNVFVKSSQRVEVGDVVSFKGVKSMDSAMAVVDPSEDVAKKSSVTFTYPEANDLTETVDKYAVTTMEYIKVSGTVLNSAINVKVGENDYVFKPIDSIDAFDLTKLGGNKVDVTGYVFGVRGANTIGIVIASLKDKGPAFVPRPSELLNAKWRFTTTKLSEYASLFGGTAGITDMTEGLSDLYVPSNVKGNGKIQYYQVDKTRTTPTSGNPKRIIGASGHPYVTGAWPGDYWLFSATDNYEYPAGTTLHIEFLTRISATGQKYWMLEYYDGKEWQPAKEYPVKTETETGTDAKYNFEEPTSKVQVKCDWELAYPCREPMFRMRCVANWQSNGKGALDNPNGGTCRIEDNDDDGEDAGPLFYVTDAPDDGGGSGLPSGTTVFADDFEWLAPYSEAAGAADSVTDNNPSGTAPNIFGTADFAPLWADLKGRGYSFFNAKSTDPAWIPVSYDAPGDSYKVVYLQKNYLKFGKSSYGAGINLPALSALATPADVVIEFKWCWQVTGGFKADIMTLQVEAANGGSFEATSSNKSEELTSKQITTDGESKLEWQNASVVLKGATSATVLTIRPTNIDAKISNPERDQNRFYLDDIKISVK